MSNSGSPRVSNAGKIYLAGPVALNPDGSTLYSEDPADCGSIDAVDPKGILFDGPMTCTADGHREWSAWPSLSDYEFAGDIAVGSTGNVFLPDSVAYGLDATGNLLWKSPLLMSSLGAQDLYGSGAILDSNGTMFFVLSDDGSREGDQSNVAPLARLIALDSQSGAVKSTYDFTTYCVSTGIAIGINGQMYVECGGLYEFGDLPQT